MSTRHSIHGRELSGPVTGASHSVTGTYVSGARFPGFMTEPPVSEFDARSKTDTRPESSKTLPAGDLTGVLPDDVLAELLSSGAVTFDPATRSFGMTRSSGEGRRSRHKRKRDGSRNRSRHRHNKSHRRDASSNSGERSPRSRSTKSKKASHVGNTHVTQATAPAMPNWPYPYPPPGWNGNTESANINTSVPGWAYPWQWQQVNPAGKTPEVASTRSAIPVQATGGNSVPHSTPVLVDNDQRSDEDSQGDILSLCPHEEELEQFELGRTDKRTKTDSISVPASKASTQVSHARTHSSSEEEPDEAWSFDRAINEVYKLLPESMCPAQVHSERKKVLSSIEKLSTSDNRPPMKLLPHSSLVSDTLSVIEAETKKSRTVKGWSVPTSVIHPLAQQKYYKVHSPSFPIKPPVVDADASKVGITAGSNVVVPVKVLEALEAKMRSLVTMASHADLFSAASFQLLSEPELSPLALQRLLQAVSRTSRHSLALLLASASDICQLRRDAALDTTTILLEHSKAKLRAAPLNSAELFGGLIGEVATQDLTDHQIRALSGVTTSRNRDRQSSNTRQGRAFKRPASPRSAYDKGQGQPPAKKHTSYASHRSGDTRPQSRGRGGYRGRGRGRRPAPSSNRASSSKQ